MKASKTNVLIILTASYFGVAVARKSLLRSVYYEAKKQAKTLASEAKKFNCFSISHAESCVNDCQWLSCTTLDVDFCAPADMAAEGNKVCGAVNAEVKKVGRVADETACIALNQTDCSGSVDEKGYACAWCSCSIMGYDVEACLADGDYAGYCDCDATPGPGKDANASAPNGYDGDNDLKKLLHAEDLSPFCVNEKSEDNCAASNDGCSWCSCSVIGNDFNVCLEDNAALQVGSYCACTDQLENTKKSEVENSMFETCVTVPDPLNCTASTGILGAHCELCVCNAFGRSLEVCIEDFEVDTLDGKCTCQNADKADQVEQFNMFGYLTYR